MSVYVDPMAGCLPNSKWKWRKNCHLFADSDEELQDFAQKLGLKRSWHQDHTALSHYDLTEGKRKQAVRLGAIEVSSRQMAEHIARARSEKNIKGT